MSDTYISPSLRQLVAERANYRCEYCLVHTDDVLLSHQADHIIAEQHGGATSAENLAFACVHCNRQKGPNIASIDPISSGLTPLFNPRTQIWDEHFSLEQASIQPITSVGRVTVQILKLNHPDRIRVRQVLIEAGTYP
ncbi:MAG: HNH endonuclease [Chloroflexi bacterium]|nr:HNH endonuclease [Chloroflexota bacterium]